VCAARARLESGGGPVVRAVHHGGVRERHGVALGSAGAGGGVRACIRAARAAAALLHRQPRGEAGLARAHILQDGALELERLAAALLTWRGVRWRSACERPAKRVWRRERRCAARACRRADVRMGVRVACVVTRLLGGVQPARGSCAAARLRGAAPQPRRLRRGRDGASARARAAARLSGAAHTIGHRGRPCKRAHGWHGGGKGARDADPASHPQRRRRD
jgi:hypothetical protein